MRPLGESAPHPFDQAVLAAIRDGADGLHAACWKRGVKGVLAAICHEGVLVGHRRVFSDKVTELLMKGHHGCNRYHDGFGGGEHSP